MERFKAFCRLIELMCYSGISVSDIEKSLQNMPVDRLFDLAVKDEQEVISRVPFAQHQNVDRQNIVGIYPFKTDERFLELAENHPESLGIYSFTNTWGKEDTIGIPSEHDFKKLNGILTPLNDALRTVQADPFNDVYVIRHGGSYYPVATFNYRKDCYYLPWINPKCRRYRKPERYLKPYQDDMIEVGTYLLEKEAVLPEVINLITGYGISVQDIRCGLQFVPTKAQFDIAIIEADGNIARVPFAQHQAVARQSIVGIYPFKDDTGFLELHEESDADSCDSWWRTEAINLEVLRRLDKISVEFNKALKLLKYKPFTGNYLVQKNIGGVKGFLNSACTADCADEKSPVKLRRYLHPDQYNYVVRNGKLELVNSFKTYLN